MSRLLCIFLLSLLTTTVKGEPVNNVPDNRKAVMNTVNSTLTALLGLSADTYFIESHETLFNLQTSFNQALATLPAPETETLMLGGLPSLDVDLHQDLPILLLRYASGMRNWKISTALNYYLLAQDLDSGQLKIHSLAEKGEERAATPVASAGGQQPDNNTADATGTALRRYFLRESLNLNWQPSRLAFTVINYDAASNTLPVTLTKTNRAQPKAVLPIVHTSDFLQPLPESLSHKTGIKEIGLSIDRSISPHIVIQGYIHAALSSVPAARSSAMAEHADVILATLLLVGLDQPPLPVNLAIPATLHGEPGSQQLSADFRFDVTPLLGKAHKAGVYQVYLLAGLQTFGPLIVIVD